MNKKNCCKKNDRTSLLSRFSAAALAAAVVFTTGLSGYVSAEEIPGFYTHSAENVQVVRIGSEDASEVPAEITSDESPACLYFFTIT